MEPWQLKQRIMFGKSTDKEKDLKRIEHTLDKAIELDPTPVAYAARAMNSPNVFRQVVMNFLRI